VGASGVIGISVGFPNSAAVEENIKYYYSGINIYRPPM
jgi:hypothetical protein